MRRRMEWTTEEKARSSSEFLQQQQNYSPTLTLPLSLKGSALGNSHLAWIMVKIYINLPVQKV